MRVGVPASREIRPKTAKSARGTPVVHAPPRMLDLLLNPSFWDKKVRIAVLTLLTFAAMC